MAAVTLLPSLLLRSQMCPPSWLPSRVASVILPVSPSIVVLSQNASGAGCGRSTSHQTGHQIIVWVLRQSASHRVIVANSRWNWWANTQSPLVSAIRLTYNKQGHRYIGLTCNKHRIRRGASENATTSAAGGLARSPCHCIDRAHSRISPVAPGLEPAAAFIHEERRGMGKGSTPRTAPSTSVARPPAPSLSVLSVLFIREIQSQLAPSRFFGWSTGINVSLGFASYVHGPWIYATLQRGALWG